MSSPVSPTYDCYDSVGNPIKARILDLIEPPGFTTSLASQTVYSRRAAAPLINPTTLPILETTSGWAISAARFQGMLWAEASSLAATRKTRVTSRFLMPVGEDISLAPAASRIPLRFQHEIVIFRTAPLVAAAPLAFGIQSQGGSLFELSDTTLPGYELVSRSDVNAGRWTVRARLANAGALVVVQDTGINPATTPQIHACLRYDLDTTPKMSFIVNGVQYGLLTGIAAIPVFTTSLQAIGLVQGLSVGGGAAQVDRSRQSRVWIEEL